jgi:hypothetical protein
MYNLEKLTKNEFTYINNVLKFLYGITIRQAIFKDGNVLNLKQDNIKILSNI